ncbi:CvpA family protein [Helicobacter mesocricetorum]|uniref:CvpA family protein n=1 Tax=Helicobacter mesocricetorum TaxID=87012 RepID=UPI000CF0C441|nr:CvpA family protein [Helicobacter mesocricetorum]
MADFSYFDLIIGALIILLAIRGIINGFIREISGLLGIVVGVYVGSMYSKEVGQWISSNIYTFENPSAISLIGFLILLVAIWVGALVLGEILQKLIKNTPLGIFNRILGFCFGGLKIFVILAIIFYALSSIALVKVFIDKYTHNSFLYPAMIGTGSVIIKLNGFQEETESLEEASQTAKGLNE